MIRLFRQYISLRKMVFILGEGILIYCAVTLASLLFLTGTEDLDYLLRMIWPKILLVAVVTQFSLYFNDLYELMSSESQIDLATRLIQSVGMSSILLAVVYFLWPQAIIGRWVFFLSIVFLLLFLVSWRFLYSLIIKRRLFAEKALVLGAGYLARDIIQEVKARRDMSYDIRSIVSHEKGKSVPALSNGIPIRFGFDDICGMVEADQASTIIVALDQKRGVMPYKELLKCKLRGITIIDGESFYERISGKLLIEKIAPSWFIFSDGFAKSRTSRIMKRVVDLVISSMMLTLSIPFVLLTAIAIKLDSRGPVFFSQQRVGENGKAFTLYKFRSMKTDAEEATGPIWACDDDPRITRVGKVIRRLRYDEIPQLWNVLRGDLSFVGPRPERPFFVEKLKKAIPYYAERFTVKPGVTGWAQIMYGYGASTKEAMEKLNYDLYYIKNMSIVMDIIIIFHTIKIVLLGKGSR